MKCNNSNTLLMKYMDNALSNDEALKLNHHVSNCEACKCDFFFYETILSELEDSAVIIYEPPAGFEESVMNELYSLDFKLSALNENVIENIQNVAWGLYSILFGSGVILYIYKDSILDFMLNNQYLGGYVKGFVPSFTVFSGYLENISSFFASLAFNITNFLTDNNYIILGILVVLITIQAVLYNKSKDKVES